MSDLLEFILRRPPDENVKVLISPCGYVLLGYLGHEITEWVLNPYQARDLHDEFYGYGQEQCD